MLRFFLLGLISILFSVSSLFAHFQVIMPDKIIVDQNTSNVVNVNLKFMHPFEQNFMIMPKPKEVGVFLNGKKTVLTDKLISYKINGKYTAYKFRYKIKKPGDFIFYVIPGYYFEPSEGHFIKHIAKVYVNAYGLETGWSKPVGLKAEIVPLVRPYGIFAGETFRGIVLYKGKPQANVRIEITYNNVNHKIKPPYDGFFPQVVHTDKNGIFTFTMPFPGWWGFNAILTDDKKIKKDGKLYSVELGATIWIKAEEIK